MWLHFLALLLLLLDTSRATGGVQYSKSSAIVFERKNGKVEKIHKIKLQFLPNYCEDNYYSYLCRDSSDNSDIYITYGALVKQTVVSSLGELSGELEIFTALDYVDDNKFRFSVSPDPSGTVSPTDTTLTVTNKADCTNNAQQEGLPCGQTWTASIATQNGLCDLNGDYAVAFTLECYAGILDCPQEVIDGLQEVFEFTLDSQDYCPQEIEHVDIEGTLTAYEDAGLTTPQVAYKVDQTVYFQHEFSSAVATPIAIALQSVLVSHRGTIFVLFENGVPTAEGVAVNLIVNDINDELSFYLDSSVFPINYRQMENIDVSALVQIDYVSGVNLLEKTDETVQTRLSSDLPPSTDSVTVFSFESITVSNGPAEILNEVGVKGGAVGSTSSVVITLGITMLASIVAVFHSG